IVHSRLAAGKPIRPGLKSTVAPTLNLWPDMRALQLAPTAARSPYTRQRSPLAAGSAHRVQILARPSRLLDLTRLLAATAPVVFEHKGNPVALVEGADASLLEGRGMDEHVLAAILGLDETIALSGIEKLHRTSDAHVGIPFPKEAWIGRSCLGPHARPLHLRRGKANRPLGKQQNRNLEDVPSQGYTGCAGIWGRIGAEARLIP